jgi:hypothetical protein
VTFFAQATDQTQVNLGNARTLNNNTPESNLVHELNLTGNRYNIAVAVFFVPYVIFDAPCGLVES